MNETLQAFRDVLQAFRKRCRRFAGGLGRPSSAPHAAAHMRGDLLVLECRSLNTPHAFEMRFASSGDGMRMELFSPLDVFGEEKLLEAGRPQRKVER